MINLGDGVKGKVSRTYLVFVIQAYESASDTGQLSDVITLELIDKNIEKAIKRARKIIKKKFYRISSVIEKETCQFQQM